MQFRKKNEFEKKMNSKKKWIRKKIDLFDIRCVALSVQNNRIAINPASKTNEKGGHDWNGALNGARRKGSHFLNVRKQINIRW